MRMSDWSSTCALPISLAQQHDGAGDGDHRLQVEHQRGAQRAGVAHGTDHGEEGPGAAEADVGEGAPAAGAGPRGEAAGGQRIRAETRRVGQEGVGKCRSWWSLYHYRNNQSHKT